ncbi:MAG: hypothetical protein QN122_10075 [Armatimonadota bacterium]|nr:hypothetical protein [Armatimonadota bacterium]MDR7449676.1 hypothetical protein [Armatimonadota bacterium]MDR7460648.1 hypothetical protein [Armatimonadota bacterium]MDR7480717.1 hypothetical protein [Armatimonadota bacterium]MDR7489029.1 hypothetical protein [Armatimonadota bacterium]
MLSHPHLHAYARLSPEEAALWDLMDGSRSVRDLILAHFAQTGTLALGLVAGLVAHLH